MAGSASTAGGPGLDASTAMELNTRCPDCETVFPVALAQLQLRKGYIRCVQCAHIFDGFEAAVPGAPQRPDAKGAPPPAAAEPSIPVTPANQTEPRPQERPAHQPFIIPPPDRSRVDGPQPARPFSIGGGNEAAPEPRGGEHSMTARQTSGMEQAQEPRLPSVVRQRDDIRAGTAAAGPSFTISEPGNRAQAARSEPEAVVIEPHAARRSGRYEPEFMGEHRRRQAWMTPVWAVLILSGLVLLAVQGAYIYRLQLANAFPDLRPVLEKACAQMGCTVPYERQISAIAITGSALRSSGPPQDEVSQLVLEVTLRNAHERPQEWPTLVLDLKDASGAVVVRRNLDPDTWVPATLRGGPFAAGSEVKVQLPVAVRGLQPNGYQLDKFFP